MDSFILELGWVHSHWAVLGWSRSTNLEWDTNPGARDLFHQGLMSSELSFVVIHTTLLFYASLAATNLPLTIDTETGTNVETSFPFMVHT